MSLSKRMLVLVALLALLAAACSGDEGDTSTTTTEAGATATTVGSATGGDGQTGAQTGSSTTVTSTTVDLGELVIPAYTIVSREEGEDGDTVVVLLDSESYDGLTDIDLQNVIADVVDEFPPVFEAYVVDDERVAELVVADPAELDAAARRLLNLHYLVRLEDGFRIVYEGPYEDSGVVILGS